MVKYILKRLGFSFLTILLASSILFILLQLMPGKPWDSQKIQDEEQIRQLEDKYDLDEPMWLRYGTFVGGVLGFKIDIDDGGIENVDYQVLPSFGKKWRGDQQPVMETITDQFPISARIGFQGLIWGLFVGLLFGVVSALRRNTIWDHGITMLAVIGVSVPAFVFAIILQYYVGFKLGMYPLAYDIADPAASTVLPSFALSLFVIASLTRFMRTELVDVLGTDYILLARAKGLSKPKVIVKHALRNALIPVITVLGPLTLAILSGSVVIEQIFSIPGIGRELVKAITTKDIPLILGLSFFFTFLYVLVILLVDISYGIIDPRVRVQGGEK